MSICGRAVGLIFAFSFLLLANAVPCNFLNDTDYGGDGPEGKIAAASPQDCCDACAMAPQCVAAIYYQNVCYIKFSMASPYTNPGRTACVPANHNTINYPNILGSVHEAGCYNRSTDPFLLDGAKTIRDMGSRVIKVALYNPISMYVWNSNWPATFNTLVDIAKHPYYQQLFAMDFSTFILVAYSVVNGVGSDNYWNQGISPSQEQMETQQFYDLSTYLLTTYSGTGKSFVIQHWEGDWSIRGDFDPNQKPTDTAINGMIGWLGARQAGVTQARNAVKSDVVIYHATEVNLVYTSMTEGFPNMVLVVTPYVALDMISYSSYDTEQSPLDFGQALDFIIAHHNRTAVSPPIALYIGEYGLPQNLVSNDSMVYMMEGVVNTALARGCPYITFWEVYCNECQPTPCSCASTPITNPANLNGYWLVKPDGTKVWAYNYLQQLYTNPPPLSAIDDFGGLQVLLSPQNI